MQRSLILLPLVAMAPACSGQTTKSPDRATHQSAASTPMAAPAAVTPQAPLPAAFAGEISAINQAGPAAPPPQPAAPPSPPSPFAIRAEVLLARARFSPGVVDGQFGSNFKHAIAAYQTAHNLPVTGTIDARTWQSLSAEPASGQPAAHDYAITAADVAGPFAADVGEDFVKLAALPFGPQFTNVAEALAERFHMRQDLLKALNPGVNFSAAGTRIVVTEDEPAAFAKGDVARVDVTKSDASVRAYDQTGALIAFYPATVGSTERPSPSGIHKVVGVARNPTYTYDPKKLAWGPRAAGKLIVKSGPNNPVGTVWIDLNAPSYGIHGTPDPDKIGKTASHGCVRLTNWDAQALAAGVKPGVVVRFIGNRGG
jgi:lipoprotein-anchoring transpeptidase ErfK/SrfK